MHHSHPDVQGSRLDWTPEDGVSWGRKTEGRRLGGKGRRKGHWRGGERRAGQASQPAAAHRELSIAGVPTQLPTLFILNMNINEGLLKYGHSFPPRAAATRPECQHASAARARPCSATDLSCLECEKSACCPLPTTRLWHKTTSVLCVCVGLCVDPQKQRTQRGWLHCLTLVLIRCLSPCSPHTYSKSM